METFKRTVQPQTSCAVYVFWDKFLRVRIAAIGAVIFERSQPCKYASCFQVLLMTDAVGSQQTQHETGWHSVSADRALKRPITGIEKRIKRARALPVKVTTKRLKISLSQLTLDALIAGVLNAHLPFRNSRLTTK